MTQRFDTYDVLRLDVEQDPAPGELVNLIPNPSGELGGWGWITPVPNTVMNANDDRTRLAFTTSAAQAAYFLSERAPITGGHYAAARLVTDFRNSSTNTIRARLVFTNDAGGVLLTGPQTAQHGLGTLQVPTVQAPAGATYVQLRVDLYDSGANPTAGGGIRFYQATLATSASTAGLGTSRTNLLRYGTSFDYDPEFYWSAYNFAERSYVSPGYVGARASRYTATYNTIANGRPIGVSGDAAPVSPGLPYTAQQRARCPVTPMDVDMVLSVLNATAHIIAEFRQTFTVGASWTLLAQTFVAPSGATQVKIKYEASRAGAPMIAGDALELDAGMIEFGDEVLPWFNGDTADAGGIVYSWTGTANASTSQAVSAAQLAYLPPVAWLSILGTAHSLTIDRSAGPDVGELDVQFKDAQLDPAASGTIRPGKRCRLVTKNAAGAWAEPLMTATIRNGKVRYNLLHPDAAKRAEIQITATDNATPLANTPRSEVVPAIAQLPHVLEGAGVPWNVNGSGNQVGAATVVAVNENASALDVVGLVRDSALGQAWIDRRNVLNVWDAASMTKPAVTTLDEDDYSDLNVDYDTDRCINTVRVTFLRMDPATGETEEIPYGPYVDAESVRRWDQRSADFTIAWEDEDPAAIEAYARAILAANGTPAVQVNSVTLPVRTVADVTRLGLLDLMDRVEIVNGDGNIANEMLIQGVAHAITPDSWTVTLSFVAAGNVATPSTPPAPPSGPGGKTLRQLLRPVGEVTMWFGSAANAPDGWLVLDGSAFSSAEYPELAAHLGGTLLPDFNGRIPIGTHSGLPLGQAAGWATATLTKDHMPAHNHGAAGEHRHTVNMTNTTGAGWNMPKGQASGAVTTVDSMPINAAGNHTHATEGGGQPFSILPPVRSLHFIIRAR